MTDQLRPSDDAVDLLRYLAHCEKLNQQAGASGIAWTQERFDSAMGELLDLGFIELPLSS